MKTAQSYLNRYKRLLDSGGSAYWVTSKDFKRAINEARLEAINEASKKIIGTVYNGAKWDVTDFLKESILSLKNNIK